MRSRMLGLALGAAGVVLLAACGGSTSPYGGGGGGGGSCTPTATKVCMGTTTFSPTNLTIAAGTAVTWQNGSGTTHTVTSSSSSTETFNSGTVGGAGTYAHTFPTAGTYDYYCTLHGADGTPPTGMHGTVTVQ
jgi:plastocyanin